MKKSIIVIGGGVSGITTALTLQMLGYDTTVIAEKVANQVADKNSHPEFASLFPSASVIPHSVYSDQLEGLFKLSQSFFYELRKNAFPGLTLHKHFEVFESPVEQPLYIDWMPNMRPIDEMNPQNIPHRQGAKNLHGWLFDCIFADWPRYFPALVQAYVHSGGQIVQRKITKDDLSDLPSDTIINCSGTGSFYLFPDPDEEQLLLRGHLLHLPGPLPLREKDNQIISYNYTPGSSTYADASGNPCDVYCYPRKDGWILGGSRQEDCLIGTGDQITEYDNDCYEIDGITFPTQIIELNKEILQATFDLPFPTEKPIPCLGYRYVRNLTNGLRLDQEKMAGKIIYHNYGHGGAGVSLSWGCALELAKKITQTDSVEIKPQLLSLMERLSS